MLAYKEDKEHKLKLIDNKMIRPNQKKTIKSLLKKRYIKPAGIWEIFCGIIAELNAPNEEKYESVKFHTAFYHWINGLHVPRKLLHFVILWLALDEIGIFEEIENPKKLLNYMPTINSSKNTKTKAAYLKIVRIIDTDDENFKMQMIELALQYDQENQAEME